MSVESFEARRGSTGSSGHDMSSEDGMHPPPAILPALLTHQAILDDQVNRRLGRIDTILGGAVQAIEQREEVPASAAEELSSKDMWLERLMQALRIRALQIVRRSAVDMWSEITVRHSRLRNHACHSMIRRRDRDTKRKVFASWREADSSKKARMERIWWEQKLLELGKHMDEQQKVVIFQEQAIETYKTENRIMEETVYQMQAAEHESQGRWLNERLQDSRTRAMTFDVIRQLQDCSRVFESMFNTQGIVQTFESEPERSPRRNILKEKSHVDRVLSSSFMRWAFCSALQRMEKARANCALQREAQKRSRNHFCLWAELARRRRVFRYREFSLQLKGDLNLVRRLLYSWQRSVHPKPLSAQTTFKWGLFWGRARCVRRHFALWARFRHRQDQLQQISRCISRRGGVLLKARMMRTWCEEQSTRRRKEHSQAKRKALAGRIARGRLRGLLRGWRERTRRRKQLRRREGLCRAWGQQRAQRRSLLRWHRALAQLPVVRASDQRRVARAISQLVRGWAEWAQVRAAQRWQVATHLRNAQVERMMLRMRWWRALAVRARRIKLRLVASKTWARSSIGQEALAAWRDALRRRGWVRRVAEAAQVRRRRAAVSGVLEAWRRTALRAKTMLVAEHSRTERTLTSEMAGAAGYEGGSEDWGRSSPLRMLSGPPPGSESLGALALQDRCTQGVGSPGGGGRGQGKRAGDASAAGPSGLQLLSASFIRLEEEGGEGEGEAESGPEGEGADAGQTKTVSVEEEEVGKRMEWEGAEREERQAAADGRASCTEDVDSGAGASVAAASAPLFAVGVAPLPGDVSWLSLGGDTAEGFAEACSSLEEAIGDLEDRMSLLVQASGAVGGKVEPRRAEIELAGDETRRAEGASSTTAAETGGAALPADIEARTPAAATERTAGQTPARAPTGDGEAWDRAQEAWAELSALGLVEGSLVPSPAPSDRQADLQVDRGPSQEDSRLGAAVPAVAAHRAGHGDPQPTPVRPGLVARAETWTPASMPLLRRSQLGGEEGGGEEDASGPGGNESAWTSSGISAWLAGSRADAASAGARWQGAGRRESESYTLAEESASEVREQARVSAGEAQVRQTPEEKKAEARGVQAALQGRSHHADAGISPLRYGSEASSRRGSEAEVRRRMSQSRGKPTVRRALEGGWDGGEDAEEMAAARGRLRRWMGCLVESESTFAARIELFEGRTLLQSERGLQWMGLDASSSEGAKEVNRAGRGSVSDPGRDGGGEGGQLHARHGGDLVGGDGRETSLASNVPRTVETREVGVSTDPHLMLFRGASGMLSQMPELEMSKREGPERGLWPEHVTSDDVATPQTDVTERDWAGVGLAQGRELAEMSVAGGGSAAAAEGWWQAALEREAEELLCRTWLRWRVRSSGERQRRQKMERRSRVAARGEMEASLRVWRHAAVEGRRARRLDEKGERRAAGRVLGAWRRETEKALWLQWEEGRMILWEHVWVVAVAFKAWGVATARGKRSREGQEQVLGQGLEVADQGAGVARLEVIDENWISDLGEEMSGENEGTEEEEQREWTAAEREVEALKQELTALQAEAADREKLASAPSLGEDTREMKEEGTKHSEVTDGEELEAADATEVERKTEEDLGTEAGLLREVERDRDLEQLQRRVEQLEKQVQTAQAHGRKEHDGAAEVETQAEKGTEVDAVSGGEGECAEAVVELPSGIAGVNQREAMTMTDLVESAVKGREGEAVSGANDQGEAQGGMSAMSVSSGENRDLGSMSDASEVTELLARTQQVEASLEEREGEVVRLGEELEAALLRVDAEATRRDELEIDCEFERKQREDLEMRVEVLEELLRKARAEAASRAVGADREAVGTRDEEEGGEMATEGETAEEGREESASVGQRHEGEEGCEGAPGERLKRVALLEAELQLAREELEGVRGEVEGARDELDQSRRELEGERQQARGLKEEVDRLQQELYAPEMRVLTAETATATDETSVTVNAQAGFDAAVVIPTSSEREKRDVQASCTVEVGNMTTMTEELQVVAATTMTETEMKNSITMTDAAPEQRDQAQELGVMTEVEMRCSMTMTDDTSVASMNATTMTATESVAVMTMTDTEFQTRGTMTDAGGATRHAGTSTEIGKSVAVMTTTESQMRNNTTMTDAVLPQTVVQQEQTALIPNSEVNGSEILVCSSETMTDPVVPEATGWQPQESVMTMTDCSMLGMADFGVTAELDRSIESVSAVTMTEVMDVHDAETMTVEERLAGSESSFNEEKLGLASSTVQLAVENLESELERLRQYQEAAEQELVLVPPVTWSDVTTMTDGGDGASPRTLQGRAAVETATTMTEEAQVAAVMTMTAMETMDSFTMTDVWKPEDSERQLQESVMTMTDCSMLGMADFGVTAELEQLAESASAVTMTESIGVKDTGTMTAEGVLPSPNSSDLMRPSQEIEEGSAALTSDAVVVASLQVKVADMEEEVDGMWGELSGLKGRVVGKLEQLRETLQAAALEPRQDCAQAELQGVQQPTRTSPRVSEKEQAEPQEDEGVNSGPRGSGAGRRKLYKYWRKGGVYAFVERDVAIDGGARGGGEGEDGERDSLEGLTAREVGTLISGWWSWREEVLRGRGRRERERRVEGRAERRGQARGVRAWWEAVEDGRRREAEGERRRERQAAERKASGFGQWADAAAAGVGAREEALRSLEGSRLSAAVERERMGEAWKVWREREREYGARGDGEEPGEVVTGPKETGLRTAGAPEDFGGANFKLTSAAPARSASAASSQDSSPGPFVLWVDWIARPAQTKLLRATWAAWELTTFPADSSNPPRKVMDLRRTGEGARRSLRVDASGGEVGDAAHWQLLQPTPPPKVERSEGNGSSRKEEGRGAGGGGLNGGAQWERGRLRTGESRKHDRVR